MRGVEHYSTCFTRKGERLSIKTLLSEWKKHPDAVAVWFSLRAQGFAPVADHFMFESLSDEHVADVLKLQYITASMRAFNARTGYHS